MNPGRDLADLDIRLSEAKLAWQGRIYNHALQAAEARDASGKPGRENSLKGAVRLMRTSLSYDSDTVP